MAKKHNRIQLLFWMQDIKSLRKNKDGLSVAERNKIWWDSLKTTHKY